MARALLGSLALAAFASAQDCAAGSPSIYTTIKGVNDITGAPFDMSALAGSVTLFTNVASF